jgi:hypothetical protein
MLLSTAFLFGFLGSLHCLGMCAPIAWAIPQNEKKRSTWAVNRLAYNSGRLFTYSILGVLVGVFGELLAFAGIQQWLSILAGITVVIGALVLNGKIPTTIRFSPAQKAFLFIKTKIGHLLKVNNFKSNFSLGLLNGMLPCGLVYMALVAAMSMGSLAGGSAYMALFGLGTFPMMIGAAFLGISFKGKFTKVWFKFMPKMLVLVGLILILRGMNLGIPYLSSTPTSLTEITICTGE